MKFGNKKLNVIGFSAYTLLCTALVFPVKTDKVCDTCYSRDVVSEEIENPFDNNTFTRTGTVTNVSGPVVTVAVDMMGNGEYGEYACYVDGKGYWRGQEYTCKFLPYNGKIMLIDLLPIK